MQVAQALGDAGGSSGSLLIQLAGVARSVDWQDLTQWDAVSTALLSLPQATQTRLLHMWLGPTIPLTDCLSTLPLTLHSALLTACMSPEAGLEISVPIQGHVILATLSQFQPPASPLKHLHLLFENPDAGCRAHALTHSTNAMLLSRTLTAHAQTLSSLRISHGGLCADALATLQTALHHCRHVARLHISFDPLLMHADAHAAFSNVLCGMAALQELELDTDPCMPPAPAVWLPAALSAAAGLTKLTLSGARMHAAAAITLPRLHTLEIYCTLSPHPATPTVPPPAAAAHVQLTPPLTAQPLPLPAMLRCPVLTALTVHESGGSAGGAAATAVAADGGATGAFAAVQEHAALQRLEIVCSRILPAEALRSLEAAVAGLSALSYLKFVAGDMPQALLALPMALAGVCGTLEELRVSAAPKCAEAGLAASWGPFLTALGQCQALQTLYLRIEADIDVPALGDALSQLKHLQGLEVFDESAGEDGSACVTAALTRALPELSRLETLTLSVLVSAAAHDALCCTLGTLKSLTRLSLDFAVFEDPRGAEPALARALGVLPALREVCENADDLEESWPAVVRGALRGGALKDVYVSSMDEELSGFAPLCAEARREGVEAHLCK